MRLSRHLIACSPAAAPAGVAFAQLRNTCPLGTGPANPMGSSTLKVVAPKIET